MHPKGVLDNALVYGSDVRVVVVKTIPLFSIHVA
jgi:hypothetical protein